MILRKLFLITAVSLLAANVFCSNGYMEMEALESKKSELISIRNGNPAEEKEILENAKREYDSAARQIDAQLVRIAETDSNGNLLAEVRQRREAEKAEIKAEIDKRAQNEIAALKNGDTAYEKEIYASIQQMEKDLKVVRVIDSYEYPDLLSIKSYAGDKYYWNTVVKFTLGTNTVFTQNVPLYYEKVSGKAPVKLSKADQVAYDEYLDAVDYYDDDMRYNNGTVVFEIEYIISACDINQPSTYTVQIKNMRFVNKSTNTVIQTVTPVSSTYTIKMSPAIDLRVINTPVYSGSASVSSSGSGSGNKSLSSDSGNSSSASTGIPAYTPSKPVVVNECENDERYLVGCSFGTIPLYHSYDLDEFYVTGNGFFVFPLYNNLFCQMDMGIIPTPSRFGDYRNSSEVIFDAMFGLGINHRVNLFGYKPNLYISGALGFGTSSDLSISGHSDYDPMLFLARFSTGVDFPIGSLLVLTSEYSLWIVEDAGVASNYSIGFSIDLN
ncbi:MAG: hypothetical protein MJ179_06660 [Treponema sp.]|nr:hypothetical protein [Treponema sp.]